MKKVTTWIYIGLFVALFICCFCLGSGRGEGFKTGTTGTDTTMTGKVVQGKGDNYNHYNGTSSPLTSGQTFYGAKGGSVVVQTNADGTQNLKVILTSGAKPLVFSSSSSSTIEGFTERREVRSRDKVEGFTERREVRSRDKVEGFTTATFTGPQGSQATVVETTTGQEMVDVKTSQGNYVFTSNPNEIIYYGSSNPGTSNPPPPPPPPPAPVPAPAPAPAPAPSSYDSSSYDTYPMDNTYKDQYYDDPNPNGTYNDSLPPGIPASQIPPGQEDLYILKSQVVPPVCPPPPPITTVPRQEACPPCPACARCPEPSFDCKKVPNYDLIPSEFVPSTWN
jgi:hypothetical protein